MTSKRITQLKHKRWEKIAKMAWMVHKGVPPFTWKCNESTKSHLMIDAEGITIGYVGYEHCGCDPKDHEEEQNE